MLPARGGDFIYTSLIIFWVFTTYLMRESRVQARFFVHIWRREAESDMILRVVRYDTKTLDWTWRSSNQIQFLSYISNHFMFRKEIRTCNFSMIYDLHMFKADWQWKGKMLADWSHDNTEGIRGFWQEIAVGSGNTGGIWGFWQEIAVGSGKQPIRELVASIAVEYGLRSYGCKPIESSVT